MLKLSREMKIKLSSSTYSPELQQSWKIEKKNNKERSRDGEWENRRKQARRRKKGKKENICNECWWAHRTETLVENGSIFYNSTYAHFTIQHFYSLADVHPKCIQMCTKVLNENISSNIICGSPKLQTNIMTFSSKMTNKLWCIRTREYCLAMKTNEMSLHPTEWTNCIT